jgi:hypothetical protein
VAEDRAVLHQSVAQEELLARLHIRAREHLAARRVDHAYRNRRLLLVRAVGEQPEHEEAEQHDQGHRLHPAARDKELPPLLRHAHRYAPGFQTMITSAARTASAAP